MLEIQAQDRIGLLYDLFTLLGNLDAEVLNARISTQAGAAIDRFYLVDSKTEKRSSTRIASPGSRRRSGGASM